MLVKSVLLVDDDQMILTVLKRQLEYLKIEDIHTANDGQEGLSLLQSEPVNPPDVIFCDLNMPNMDGIEFLRKAVDSGFSGGVVLMSGEDIRILKSVAGLADSYTIQFLGALEKPFSLRQLQTILSSYKVIIDNDEKKN